MHDVLLSNAILIVEHFEWYAVNPVTKVKDILSLYRSFNYYIDLQSIMSACDVSKSTYFQTEVDKILPVRRCFSK